MNMKLLNIIGNRSYEEAKYILSNPPYNCSINELDPYFLIKYNQIKSDFSNKAVRECRGIILDKDTYQVVCRPFDKFFNYGEIHAAKIDWNSAIVTEKIDGSILKVWWSERWSKWMISTNGVIDAFQAEIQNDLLTYKTYEDIFTFGQLFVSGAMKSGLDYSKLNKNCTYIFELVSPYTKVVIHYPEIKIYHLATRHNNTYQYLEQNIGVEKPKKFTMSSLEEIVDVANKLPFDKEGYVVRDKNWNMIKIKSPAYVAVHHLKNNGVVNKSRILDLILMGEDEEFAGYFPEFKDVVSDLREKYDNLVDEIHDVILNDFLDYERKYIRGYINRKEFAKWATSTKIPALFFSLLDKKVKDSHEFLSNISRDKLISIMES